MPLAKRIIPCLDVNNGRVVKGIHFAKVKDAGNPVELAEKYMQQGADELVFLDITASQERRDTMKAAVRDVARVIDIPFTVGGGIKKLEDARNILLNGADKVSVNTSAVNSPDLVTQLMEIFGKQCVVVAIDAKRTHYVENLKKNMYDGSKNKNKNNHNSKTQSNNDRRKYWFEVRIYGGKEGTGIDAIEWAKRVERLGAGEILLTSIDSDGTENGYDIELTELICKAVRIPVIASGGCGQAHHMLQVFEETDVDAALAASIFHYDKYTVNKVKKYLDKNGIRVRL
jgi:cyclase